MKILGMDSATGACSAALWSDGAVAARRFAAMDRGQSEALIPMVQAVLEESRLTFGQLDGLGVTVGPGAFTGLRIGLAAARGIALASGLPLVGVTSFEAVAHGVPAPERSGCALLIALESRREDIFVQSFDSELNPLGAPRAARPEDLELADGPLLVAGDASARLAAALASRREGLPAGLRFAEGPGLPDAAHVARLVALRGLAGALGGPPQPLYLRPPDVTLPPPRTR
ncbi:tRNA (adenosine(37)-N6)-threonylcarbamoyltransferase complex dimerization subunit type 1 TsaB [Skermanella mucosa]|uniref:tRNA (adenosine(37)-N6)-threonylcarbamoyltransferase complex dimerization subunit type 1 TsaB n=1 Tax=Skermanella mucosa TaxID=1789672 RepID=UPI00192C5C84|nr:tRNA (adenosine(37)-N6)-threonylcarbamoyltransferase complex dimerization subunit type 1 TsaB [Skermanella mucosa]UEM21182.1 tRNA (adenosine(37)-N6)-threonylcarbamoyltransferase complex dimerization subunit type 1 TsaB [Skermanella mucosa]